MSEYTLRIAAHNSFPAWYIYIYIFIGINDFVYLCCSNDHDQSDRKLKFDSFFFYIDYYELNKIIYFLFQINYRTSLSSIIIFAGTKRNLAASKSVALYAIAFKLAYWLPLASRLAYHRAQIEKVAKYWVTRQSYCWRRTQRLIFRHGDLASTVMFFHRWPKVTIW